MQHSTYEGLLTCQSMYHQKFKWNYLHRVGLSYGLNTSFLLQIRNLTAWGLATLFDREAQYFYACAGNQMILMNCCLLHMSLIWYDSFQNISNLISSVEYSNIGWSTSRNSTTCFQLLVSWVSSTILHKLEEKIRIFT